MKFRQETKIKARTTAVGLAILALVVGVIFLGLSDELGTLEAGKLADIVIIDGAPLTDVSDLVPVAVMIQGGRVIVDNR